MSDGLRDTRWLPERDDNDPHRLALLIPGAGYSPDRPLLHFARAVLRRHGWSTRQLWWPTRPPADPDGRPDWVNAQVAAALQGERADTVLLVGKSLGTMAATTAAARGLPAIWLTPLLDQPWLVQQLRRATAPTLLVGGTADSMWLPDVARGLAHPLLELPGADHDLETDDDPVHSAELLTRITARMDLFVEALGAGPVG